MNYEERPPSLWKYVFRVWLAAFVLWALLFQCYKAQAQCSNPTCETAIVVPSETLVPFCNFDCGYEFYSNGQPVMDNTVYSWNETAQQFIAFECHQVQLDLWYRIEVHTEDSTICLNITQGDCLNDQFPGQEGWALMLWQGDFCSTSELVWSTNCYWLDENNPNWIDDTTLNNEDFDPTRQEWTVTLHGVENGTYYVQIDSFSWCEGCGVFSWCNGLNLLGLPTDGDYEEPVLDIVRGQSDPMQWDLLGRLLNQRKAAPFFRD